MLVGYVRADQRAWVSRTRQYNVRVGDRAGAIGVEDDVLAASVLVLWTGAAEKPEFIGAFERTGPWRFMLADELAATGYPLSADADRYLVADIEALTASADGALVLEQLEQHAAYAPRGATWADLASRSRRR